ncbi:MAG: hypothetical protein IKE17_06470, partial [Clostridia bacterium]|nr:hypothetical protein [Clostridia bacterium]
RPEQKRLPCRFAARKSPAISGKSEEDVLKGDLSPFKRAQARDKSEFPHQTNPKKRPARNDG